MALLQKKAYTSDCGTALNIMFSLRLSHDYIIIKRRSYYEYNNYEFRVQADGY